MSATVNKLVYGDLTFTDDEIQDGEVYDAVALLSDALEIGTINVGLYIRDEETGAALTAFRRNEKLLYYYRDKLRGTYYIESIQRTGKYTYEISATMRSLSWSSPITWVALHRPDGGRAGGGDLHHPLHHSEQIRRY